MLQVLERELFSLLRKENKSSWATTCRIFKYGDEPFEKLPGENFDFLMQ
jgi:hypothetical protein